MTDDPFARLSRGTFRGLDPNATIHETMIGGANIQPTGWYDQHTWSSSVGQANLLADPTFETLSNNTTTLTGSKQTVGQWAAHYVVNSGATHTILGLYRRFERGDVANNPLNTVVQGVSFAVNDAGATDTNVYLYQTTDTSPTTLPTLDWLVAGVKTFRTDAIDAVATTCTATLELLEGGTVVASSPAHDYLTDSTYTVYPMSAAWTDTAANFRANSWRWRINIHVVTNGTGAGVLHFRFGEPQMGFNYSPDPLPFSPLIGTWVPSILSQSLFVTNELTASFSTSQNDYDPGISGYNRLALSPGSSLNLTGLAGGADGRVLFLSNETPTTLTLKHESASSTTTNRFRCPGAADVAMTQYTIKILVYRAGRWYVVS